MKKLIFLFLFGVICGVSLTAQTPPAPPASTNTSTSNEIIIIATTVNTPVLRSAPAPAVNAWLSDAQIDLTFLRNLGTVTITVANTQETVYTATVTAEEGVHTVISVAGWNAGDYIITIVKSNGQTFAGEFEID
jgi:hypothetical protein